VIGKNIDSSIFCESTLEFGEGAAYSESVSDSSPLETVFSDWVAGGFVSDPSPLETVFSGWLVGEFVSSLFSAAVFVSDVEESSLSE